MSKKYTIAEVDKMANEFGHVLVQKRPALWASEIWLNCGEDGYMSDGEYSSPHYMTKDEVIAYSKECEEYENE